MKVKLQPRIFYPVRLSFRFDGEIKSFPDKQKLGAPPNQLYNKSQRNFSRKETQEKEKIYRK